ncbi:MAG: hypothetical protein K6T80_07550 [Firmicutes bacterium]|nr:hypothetical protein [Bacillota bacterium]
MKKAWETAFVLACAFATTAAMVWTADPDVFWHLKVGEWIIGNRAVPKADFYSWSAHGQPWTAHQWLWEAVIYLIHSRLGLPGLWALVFAMGSAAGLFVRAGLIARGTNGTLASLAGGAAPLLLGEWLKPWPQAGVYACFSSYLYLSLKGSWDRKSLIAVFVLSATWANIHSSAAMLPFLLAAEAAWRALDRSKPGSLLASPLISAAGTLVNPHGVGLWVYAVREGLMTHEYREHIFEWMPCSFGVPLVIGAFFISAAVMFAASGQGRMKTLEFARAAGFWVLALLSRIYMPYAIMSTAALFGCLKFEFREKYFKAAAVLIVFFGAALVFARGVPSDLEAVAEKCGYPVKAVQYLEGNQHGTLFNDYNFGGYLLWKSIPVYIDGRADLYKYDGIFERYMNLSESREKVSDYVSSTGADTALLTAASSLDFAIMESEKWECVYRDEAAAVYRKK